MNNNYFGVPGCRASNLGQIGVPRKIQDNVAGDFMKHVNHVCDIVRSHGAEIENTIIFVAGS